MSDLKKDILIGVLFMSGLLGFMAGEFIVSTVVFAAASLFSNMEYRISREN